MMSWNEMFLPIGIVMKNMMYRIRNLALFGLACAIAPFALGKNTMLNISYLNTQAQKVLNYDPEVELINGVEGSREVTITCHGCGGNKEIGHYVASQLDTPVLTFNFPDHDMDENFDVFASSFGTIQEYLPVIFLLDACVKSGISKLSLYGFSAGGGAIINALAILNNPKYEQNLARIGVNKDDVHAIIKALAVGLIILDAPLKSITEILSIRPHDHMIQVLAERYPANGFEPIEVIDQLAGLKLNVIIYFEYHDEILSNRDDQLFYQKLKAVNQAGTTQLIMGSDGGHNGFHAALWEAVKI